MVTVIPEKELIISRDPERMSGVPVFAGTRVPIQALIDELAAGSTIEEFREGFPSVKPEQIVELLHRIGDMLQTARI